MPFQIPTPTELLEQAQADMEAGILRVAAAKGDDISADGVARAVRAPHGMLNALCTVYATGRWGAHQHHRWNGDQLIADTAEFENLRLHAASYDIFQRPATRAIGRVLFEGVSSTAIPQGLRLRGVSGVTYETLEGAEIDGSGEALVDIQAVDPGAAGNLGAGSVLTLVSPLAGLDPQSAAVDEGGLAGGADAESPQSLLDRYIARKRQVPMGGAEYDYPRWVLEEFPAAHVKTVPLQGDCRDVAVGVVVAMGTREDPRPPTPAEIEAISRHLGRINGPEGKRPVTADVLVLPAVLQSVPMRITVRPDTPGVRAAVTSAVQAFFANEAMIGERLSFSRLSEAISAAPGEQSHVLIEPGRDVIPGRDRLLVPGSITWVA